MARLDCAKPTSAAFLSLRAPSLTQMDCVIDFKGLWPARFGAELVDKAQGFAADCRRRIS